MSCLKAIIESIVNRINTDAVIDRASAMTSEATFSLLPDVELDKPGDQGIFVTPVMLEEVPCVRKSTETHLTLQIGILEKFNKSIDLARACTLLELGQRILRAFAIGATDTDTGKWAVKEAAKFTPLYDPGHLKTNKQFTSVLQFKARCACG